jgi:peptidoglycan/xylan/chitin deacetylase (PgdA/CDA1 family)
MEPQLGTEISASLGALAGVALATGGCAYAALWPASRIFGTSFIAPRIPSEIALTFDDGPNPVWTPRLLDILANYSVRATFFMVGSHAVSEPALVRRVVAAGHLIGNHSWSHPNLALTLSRRVEEELVRTSDTLQQIAGRRVHFFRPPFGARRPVVFRTARELGMTPVLWNAMTSDWSDPSADSIANHLIRSIDRAERSGSAANVVLHDASHVDRAAYRGPSINAVSRLAKRYKFTHRFVTLDEWT